MKNKLFHSIFLMVASVSAVNADYYQPTYQPTYQQPAPAYNGTCWDGNYYQTPSYDTAYGADYDCDCECDIYDAYSYMTLGVGPFIVIPNIGFGYRERHAQLGWDAGVSFSTVGYVNQLQGYAVGHYYFNRCKQNSPYVGLGLQGSYVFGKRFGGGTLSPNFVLGKEFLRDGDSRQFIEMHVGIPTMWVESGRVDGMYVPLMYIKYGFSF